MRAKGSRPVVEVLFALFLGLALGWLSLLMWPVAAKVATGAHPGAHAAHAAAAYRPGASNPAWQPSLVSPNAPEVTSTPVWPDYAAQLTWDDRWACPAPVLDLTAYTVQYASCIGHITFNMHLVNASGGSRDFSTGTVHGEDYAVTVNCQVGRDIPFDWLQAMPFTLSINASVPDSNGSNNTTTLNAPPPDPIACATVTVVVSPTALPTFTNTPTCTPTPFSTPIVNLTGSMTWSATPCPAPVLKLRTTFSSYRCDFYANPSHMRLSNSIGEHMDFAVAGFYRVNGFDELDCPLGPCLPASWLDSFPLTLTVDVFNEVEEVAGGGEGDNNSWLYTQPPPCLLTPTATATLPPTPSATPTVQSLLIGHVTWQGRPPQPDARQQLPITLTLKLGATEVNYASRPTDASGSFTVSVSGMTGGTYAWRVKDPKYLANSGTVVLAGASVTGQEMGLMYVGDANDDNLVNISDFSIMKNAFGKSIGDPGYDDRADFTGDATVNLLDFNLLKINFDTSGAPPLGPGARWR